MGRKRYEPKAKTLKTITIGPALAAMRNKNGYKQREVEKALGFTHTSVSALENNRGNPPLLTLTMLTEHYGYEVADLFLPARVYKEYPNKEHGQLHSKMQEYIERGREELENMETVLNMALGENRDETSKSS